MSKSSFMAAKLRNNYEFYVMNHELFIIFAP